MALLLAISSRGDDPRDLAARLAEAAEAGDVSAVEEWLEKGADPNGQVPDSRPYDRPLFFAVRSKEPEVTRLLLKAGADPTLEDENGDTVMVYASDAERIEHARVLMEHGVSINSRNSDGLTSLMRGARYESREDIQTKLDLGADPDLTDPNGYTALMLAGEAKNLEAVETLLEAGADVSVADPDGRTALHLVAAVDDYGGRDDKAGRIVGLLLRHGAEIDARDLAGRTPLLVAVDNWSVQLPTVEALLAADPDVSVRDENGCDALYHVVADDDLRGFFGDIVKLGGDVRTRNLHGVGLLMLTSYAGDAEMVRELLKRGLEADRACEDGRRAAHFAASMRVRAASPFHSVEPDGQARVVDVLELLEAAGASMQTVDEDGDTPLHVAAFAGNLKALEWLGPFFGRLDVENLSGTTPLHLAAEVGAADCVGFLLDHVLEVDPTDQDGRTPLARALFGGAEPSREVAELLVKRGASLEDRAGAALLEAALDALDFGRLRLLVELGLDLEEFKIEAPRFAAVVRSYHGQPLDADDYAAAVELLAARVEDIDAPGEDETTALMWVAASNSIRALEAVLARGPELDARASDGRTALMWAGSALADEAYQALIDAGADAGLQDSEGRTAADWRRRFEKQAAEDVAEPDQSEPSLRQKIEASRRTALRRYLEAGEWDVTDRVAGTPPLHLAAALGEIEAMATLLDRGAPVDARAHGGVTPLMEAAANGHADAVAWLLEHDAEAGARDSRRKRAVDHALQMEHFDLALRLYALPGVKVADEVGLLVALVHLGDPDKLRSFLEKGAAIAPPADRPPQPDHFSDSYRPRASRPLEIAATAPDDSLLRVLAEFPKATGAGEKELLARALHRAAEAGRLENVRHLVEELEVDPGVPMEDAFGGVSRVVLREDAEKVGSPTYYTPLTRALEEGRDAVIEYLLKRGVEIDGRTRSGGPPLVFAVVHSRYDTAERLLKAGAEPDAVDGDGWTALHHAASGDDVRMIDLLLSHGADRGAKEESGRTPLEVARRSEATAAIERLEK